MTNRIILLRFLISPIPRLLETKMGYTEGMRLMQSTVPFSARWLFRSNASAIHSENSVMEDLYVAADAKWGNGVCIGNFNRRCPAVFSLEPARFVPQTS